MSDEVRDLMSCAKVLNGTHVVYINVCNPLCDHGALTGNCFLILFGCVFEKNIFEVFFLLSSWFLETEHEYVWRM